MLQLGDPSLPKGCALQSVDVSHLTVNASGVGTAVSVANAQYVNVGPAVMVYGFSKIGIEMAGSGGGFIHQSWLGESYPSGSRLPPPNSTAISLDGGEHDCYVQDVIIWSARVGIHSVNGGNVISGAHCWNLRGSEGGIGILVSGGLGVVEDSYLDFTPLVLELPIKGLTVDSSLFLATANLVISGESSSPIKEGVVKDEGEAEAQGQEASKADISGLTITSNRWWSERNPAYGGNETIVLDAAARARGALVVEDTVVESNSADALWRKVSTRATRVVAVEGRFAGVEWHPGREREDERSDGRAGLPAVVMFSWCGVMWFGVVCGVLCSALFCSPLLRSPLL